MWCLMVILLLIDTGVHSSTALEQTNSNYSTSYDPTTGFNPNDTWLEFSPLNKLIILQYSTSNVTIKINNNNNESVLVQLQYNTATMTTTVFVAPGIEYWNTTVPPQTIQTEVVSLYGAQPGRAALTLSVYSLNNLTVPLVIENAQYEIEVFRVHTLLQKISLFGLALGFAMTMSSWSCIMPPPTIDLYMTYKRLPLVQIVCQFILKPLVAFALIEAFSLPGPIAYGLMALGCTPGTGPSNMSTFLLGGNYNASTMMTMISALFCMVAIPFWMYTLGELIAYRTYGSTWTLYFPWLPLFIITLIFIVPSIIFYIIRRHSEFTGLKLSRLLRPLGAAVVIASFTMAVYSDLWLWPFLTDWTFIMCAFVYIVICYSLGFFGALLVRIPLPTAIAMSMEIGLQNVSIGLVVVHGTLPNPDNDNSMVIPVMYVLMMFGPVLIGLGIRIAMKIVEWKRSGGYNMESGSCKSEEKLCCDTSSHTNSCRSPSSVSDVHSIFTEMTSSKENHSEGHVEDDVEKCSKELEQDGISRQSYTHVDDVL